MLDDNFYIYTCPDVGSSVLYDQPFGEPHPHFPDTWQCETAACFSWDHTADTMTLTVNRAVPAGRFAGFRLGTSLSSPPAGVPAATGWKVSVLDATFGTVLASKDLAAHPLAVSTFSLALDPATQVAGLNLASL